MATIYITFTKLIQYLEPSIIYKIQNKMQENKEICKALSSA